MSDLVLREMGFPGRPQTCPWWPLPSVLPEAGRLNQKESRRARAPLSSISVSACLPPGRCRGAIGAQVVTPVLQGGVDDVVDVGRACCAPGASLPCFFFWTWWWPELAAGGPSDDMSPDWEACVNVSANVAWLPVEPLASCRACRQSPASPAEREGSLGLSARKRDRSNS